MCERTAWGSDFVGVGVHVACACVPACAMCMGAENENALLHMCVQAISGERDVFFLYTRYTPGRMPHTLQHYVELYYYII